MNRAFTAEWDAFIARHRADLSCHGGWELRFVEAVLRNVAGLSPASVTYQAGLAEPGGKERRIDFAINLGGNLRIAIEVDGFDKSGRGTGMDKAEFNDFLQRQNALVLQGWKVLRFSNAQVRKAPRECIEQIQAALAAGRPAAARPPEEATARRLPPMVWSLGALVGLVILLSVGLFMGVSSRMNERQVARPELARARPAASFNRHGAGPTPHVAGRENYAGGNERVAGKDKKKAVKRPADRRTTKCGKVIDARWVSKRPGRPTYLNFGRPYPNAEFVAVIDFKLRQELRRSLQEDPEKHYQGRNVCVSGRFDDKKGIPTAPVSKRAQISIR